MEAKVITPPATAVRLSSFFEDRVNCQHVCFLPGNGVNIAAGGPDAQVVFPVAAEAYFFPENNLRNVWVKGNASVTCKVIVTF
jgi:hypothetical protein